MLFVSAMRNKKNVSQESCLDLCAKPFRMYSCSEMEKGGILERKGKTVSVNSKDLKSG